MGITLSSLRCRLPHRNQEPPLQFLPAGECEASGFLPNDIIFDILCRISVKALCRIRCVSREWCALISGPDFVAAHKSRRPAEPLIVVASYHDKSCQLKLIDMDGCLVKVIIDIMGNYWRPACTGPHDVICVTSRYDFKGYVAGVIDLTTMKVLATCLARSDRDKAWGIGRVVPSGACKVVCSTSCLSEVFTMEDGAEWRPIKSLPSCNNGYYNLHRYPVEVNGILCFLTETQPDEDLSVLPFDLQREEWKDMIKGPPNVKVRPTSISLAELNGALCMVQPEIWKVIYGHINIWRLLDSQKSIWVIAYTIPFDPCKYCQMVPLRVLHDGPKLLFCNTARTGGVPILQIYDPRDGTCIDATKKLLHDHVSNVSYNVRIGLCNMQLEHFVSPKNQHISTLSEVFL